jgi:transposase
VTSYEQGNTSIRQLAVRFDVSKAFVQRLLLQKKMTGHVQPQKQGGSMKSELHEHSTQLVEMVEKYPDATLCEYCEYWGEAYGSWLSTSTMCRALKKQQTDAKKKTLRSSHVQPREFRSSDVSIGSKSRTLSQRT